jgi:hypothetical protein
LTSVTMEFLPSMPARIVSIAGYEKAEKETVKIASTIAFIISPPLFYMP